MWSVCCSENTLAVTGKALRLNLLNRFKFFLRKCQLASRKKVKHIVSLDNSKGYLKCPLLCCTFISKAFFFFFGSALLIYNQPVRINKQRQPSKQIWAQNYFKHFLSNTSKEMHSEELCLSEHCAWRKCRDPSEVIWSKQLSEHIKN